MAWRSSLTRKACITWLAFAAFLQTSEAADARPDVAALCNHAAVIAARDTGVPLDVLRAISLTETGRTISGQTRPWPWTVNMEGAGHWFRTPEEVLDYVRPHYARGARSFDLGCFQINFRWHGESFRSFEHMLDPVENARYAARFLSDLYAEFGSWTEAAGAYHSRTPKFARKYEARFERFRARLAVDQKPVVASESPRQETISRANAFPLLQTSGAPRGRASLVPLRSSPLRGRFIGSGG